MSTLTKEQEKQVDDYALEMLKNGIKSGIKTNRKEAKAAVDILYKKYLELEPPKNIVFVASPEAAIRQVVKSSKCEPKDALNAMVLVNWYTWWVAYYWAGINILGETGGVEQDLIDDLKEYEAMTKIMHAVLPCENTCFVIEYPTRLEIKDNDLEKFHLHRENGLALEYSDGTGFAWLNGVEVPDWIATTAASKLSPKKVLAETNVDIRREGLRRISLQRLLKAIKAKLLDREKKPEIGKHWNYELYDADFGDNKKRRLLRMFDVASGGHPIERVGDECSTVESALAWRDEEDEYIKPQVRT